MRTGTLQFSIRGLLLAAALLALGLATLPYGAWSGFWAMVLSTVVCGIFLFATLGGVFRRGVSQAYWGGFAIAGIGYLALVLWMLGSSEINDVGHLATTRLLQQFEAVARHEVEVPPDTPGATKIIQGGMQWGREVVGGNVLRTVVYVPNHENLMLSGHLLWGLLIGYAGGLVARHFYRTREAQKPRSD